jgi:hypothetical protein
MNSAVSMWQHGGIFAVLLLIVGMLGAVLYYVSKPRKIPCPQCKATGIMHIQGAPKKALIPQRCPYCGGTKQVWR